MGQQDGILQLKGNVGKFNFFKREGEYMARTKAGVSKSKIMNDPAFARTRENMAEFGRAGKAGKLLRSSLNALLVNCKDSSRVGRLTAAFRKVVKADSTNVRGMRNVLDGETELLTGFQMNQNSALTSTIFAPFATTIDRVTGELVVNIPAFVPLHMITAPQGTTHFQINSAGVSVDFENELYDVDVQRSASIAWDSVATAPIALTNAVPANSTHPLFLVVGIEFYQETNGALYPLKNGAFNSLAIVKVAGV
ncbi:MAG: hypothetical protein EOO19_00550 [Chryseobacterium sp.]|nr:MAG: hypothetical protein EOO19_00550 [Chryseobacterium sp.]